MTTTRAISESNADAGDVRPVLEVEDLRTHFFTRRGVVRAVNGVSFKVMPGETLGLVGESGSGKTITCLSLLRLLPRGARIVGGRILYNGRNTLDMTEKEMEELRGVHLGMILQNSMAALDPVFTIGTQVAEPLVVHSGLSWKRAMERGVDLLRMVKITARPTPAGAQLPSRNERRHAAAGVQRGFHRTEP